LAEAETKVIDTIRQDVQNARAVIENGLDLNDTMINGIWRHFADVEILVPLASMELRSEEKLSLASGILQEMDEVLAKIREGYAKATTDEELTAIHKGALGMKVDSLWKELAGCYAELINDEIPDLPENMKKAVAESLVSELAHRFDTTEDEIVDRIKHDSTLRMMFRRTGINPDEI
jgi:hypothetical protein